MKYRKYTPVNEDTKSLHIQFWGNDGEVRRVVCALTDLHFIFNDNEDHDLGFRINNSRRVLYHAEAEEVYISDDTITSILIFDKGLIRHLAIIELGYGMDKVNTKEKSDARLKKAEDAERVAKIEQRKTELLWRAWYAMFGDPE